LQRRLAESGDRIPVIFVSAHGDVSLREMVMKAGAAGFLNKPVRSDALLREIYAAIAKTLTEKHP
jgi:FixJ family two-component response regulator